jgi:hypothetical protein
MRPGSSIIGTSSVNSDVPTPTLLPYDVTQAGIANMTAALAQLLADRGVRANSVAPGPVWTPLIPSTMPPEHVRNFGSSSSLGAGEQKQQFPGPPDGIAPGEVIAGVADGQGGQRGPLAEDRRGRPRRVAGPADRIVSEQFRLPGVGAADVGGAEQRFLVCPVRRGAVEQYPAARIRTSSQDAIGTPSPHYRTRRTSPSQAEPANKPPPGLVLLLRTVAPTVRRAGSRLGLEHDLEATLRLIAEDLVPVRASSSGRW